MVCVMLLMLKIKIMELIFSALIIFALRLADQSLGTMRALLVAKNKPIYAALIGLVESVIWIIAISQVVKDIDDPILIGAYASGFAAGTILGSYIERIVGVGNIVVRVFCPANSPSVAEALRNQGHGVTIIDGHGKDGPVKIYLCVIPRRRLRSVLDMIKEIRRQFKEIPGLMEGTAEPDSEKCVEIATTAALKKMMLPGIIAVSMPTIVGFGLGAQALGGMLAGGLLGCVSLALMMANAGGAWDNAKKYVEKGNLGGKGSDTHAAAVVGDTVGDPFKDTSGPSMNILINVMAIVSLVIAPLLSI